MPANQLECILVNKEIIHPAVQNTDEDGLSQKCCKETEASSRNQIEVSSRN